MMPQLNANLCSRLLDLEARVLQHSVDLEHWFRAQWRSHLPPIYGSVDLRNACFKLAPVDTNLFPGGFNNLSDSALPVAIQAVMASAEAHCPDIRRVLLIPENHTRNLYYLRNVARLQSILQQAGLEVRLGSLIPGLQQPMRLSLETVLDEGQTASPNEAGILIEPIQRIGQRLSLADGFDPCMILLNNDLSSGIPEVLQGLSGQQLFPPLHGGWATRRKSQHFAAYREVAKEFADRLQIDPWLIDPLFGSCRGIDFHARAGEEELAETVDQLLHQIRLRYKDHGIDQKPFVVVKADAGTYGMGIMTVKDAQEIRGLNRKQRNKMAVIKEGVSVSDVLVQEGVPSFETVMQQGVESVAEPVVYMIDRYVVGGFYRVHADRGPDENLNAPGARFVPLPFEEGCHQPVTGGPLDTTNNRLYLYGVIARLALLAASRELEATHPAARQSGSSLVLPTEV